MDPPILLRLEPVLLLLLEPKLLLRVDHQSHWWSVSTYEESPGYIHSLNVIGA